jgi:S-formylglutathione hydrolase FrmB
MKRLLLLLLTIATACDTALAQPKTARLRDESFQSSALGRTMRYRVLVPADYDFSERRYPVLYLLHGLTGDYRDWTTRTNLADYSRALPLIVVMPDGENQWYTNAVNGGARFEDYVTGDLPADVVGKFRTVNSRYGRAIAGLSMGGYGALKIALKRPALYAVAGSFSGAFGVTVEGRYDRMIAATKAEPLARIFGPPGSDTRTQNDVLALARGLKSGGAPYIYLDCGTSDSLLEENREAAAALQKAGAAYEYHEVAGGHGWDYWDRRIREFLPVLMKRLAN